MQLMEHSGRNGNDNIHDMLGEALLRLRGKGPAVRKNRLDLVKIFLVAGNFL